MKTNTLIRGVALVLTLGAGSVVSAQGTDRRQPSERARGEQADSGRGPRGRFGRESLLLRGITLSESQKTRVAELGAQQRKQKDAKRPNRERGDTAGMGARRAEMQKRREQHVAAIRSVLDNGQRVQFDRNVAELKKR